MIHKVFTLRSILVIVYIAGAVGGCTSRKPAEYKVDADEKVYNIIDQKWQQDFGSKTNYKISDTTPAPDAVKIEKTVAHSGKLTLIKAVALATAHNRQYQTEKEILYTKALDLTLVRRDFEPQFFGGATGGYSKGEDSEAIGSQADFGFKQLLADGTTIATDVTAAWISILSGDLRSGLAGIFSATVTKPLLRGSSRAIVQENLTQAERDALYQLRTFNRFRKTFLVSTISQYYRVLQLFDAAENAENNYKTLSDVYDRAKKLAKAGRLPRFELDQAHQDILEANDTLIQAKKDYKQALDEFKLTLSLPTTLEFSLDPNELEALNTTDHITPDFSDSDIVQTALANRLDLANSADSIVDAERKITVAADRLRAELNLVGATKTVSEGKGDLVTLEPLRSEQLGAIEFDLPFERTAEQNVYRKALINLTQRQRDHEQAVDSIALEVRQAYRELTEAAERYEVQLESLKLAQKRFKNTLLLLQYGRANTRDVLDAQEDMFDAQNIRTEALVDYNIAVLNFYRDTGVLQVRPDGMWEH